MRIALTIILLCGPLIVLAAMPSPLFYNARFLGKGGIATDVGIYTNLLQCCGFVLLIPIARRILGDLINELVSLEIVGSSLRSFNPSRSAAGWFLRVGERITRVRGWRGPIALCIIELLNIIAYYVDLLDQRSVWHTSPASLGTFLYRFRVGACQPNLSGLWFYAVFLPLVFYSILVATRLLIVFAVLCSTVARKEELRIVPSHPDGVGGLQPVGQVALLFSVFTVIYGLNLVGVTSNQLIWNAALKTARPGTHALHWITLSWSLYLLIALIIFLLPMVPLHCRMVAAKREYLLQARRMESTGERLHREHLLQGSFRPEALQGLVALDNLIREAMEMATWPFDRKAFLKYTGVLIATPGTSFVVKLPDLVQWLSHHLGLA
jgi:hypothetical protein